MSNSDWIAIWVVIYFVGLLLTFIKFASDDELDKFYSQHFLHSIIYVITWPIWFTKGAIAGLARLLKHEFGRSG